MKDFTIAKEIRQSKDITEKAAMVFDLVSRVLYVSIIAAAK
jgi:hypothetical protein